jgi:hypothetical protein
MVSAVWDELDSAALHRIVIGVNENLRPSLCSAESAPRRKYGESGF